jgi:flavin-binding protein dodecin
MRRPALIALGLGCDRGTPAATITRAIGEALAAANATLADVGRRQSTSKPTKSACQVAENSYGWTIHFYSSAALAAVDVPNPSETVRKYTGTPSVSEAAALLAAMPTSPILIIEKHKLRGPDGRNATVSIARIPMNAPETLKKTGKIMLVGLGPGSNDHLTARARAAIAEADTIIGYVTYIRLVADLVVGKEVIKKSMTEELDRAIESWTAPARARKWR